MVRRALVLPDLLADDVRTQHQLSVSGLGEGVAFDEQLRPVDQATLIAVTRRHIRASEVARLATPMALWVERLEPVATRAQPARRGWRSLNPLATVRRGVARRALRFRIGRGKRRAARVALEDAMVAATRLPGPDQAWADLAEHRDELLGALRGILDGRPPDLGSTPT
jgi:hypothetical protein